MNSAVSIQRLVKRFGAVQALQGVDLDILPGEIFGLIGPNGSGKTTLIKHLATLLKPSEGRAEVGGYDVATQPRKVRQQIGYMPQAPALYEELSATQNVRFFSGAYGTRDLKERVQRVLELMDLSSRSADRVRTFSGGMKQRVSLACALLHSPPILLLDEPTAGVDPKLRRRFWDYFNEQGSRGATVIISTNQLDEVAHCDRVAILRAGRILAVGKPVEILDQGSARVYLTINSTRSGCFLKDYSTELALLLHSGGLSPAITSIEVERESFEEGLLHLIEDAERQTNEDLGERPA